MNHMHRSPDCSVTVFVSAKRNGILEKVMASDWVIVSSFHVWQIRWTTSESRDIREAPYFMDNLQQKSSKHCEWNESVQQEPRRSGNSIELL